MRIISVMSGKGGVGKTTVATNLGAILSTVFKKQIAVMDCNVTTAHVGAFLGLDHTPVTLNHVLKGAPVTEAVYHHPSGMKIIPSSLALHDMHGIDIALISDAVKAFYDAYVGQVDVLLLDCAPGLGREALAGIRASDEMLAVTVPYLPAVMDVVRCNHLVRDLGVRNVGVVLNLVGRKRHELSRTEVEGAIGLPVLAEIPADDAVLRSLAKRMPVALADPRARPTRELVRLASAVLEQQPRTPTQRFTGA
ncbi:MAG: P-loop NTPase [Candidatus Aenigmarchaeota archaeon]|nr:P-loop NTPase [Candidatus Aenigmarchaeota archaeon]